MLINLYPNNTSTPGDGETDPSNRPLTSYEPATSAKVITIPYLFQILILSSVKPRFDTILVLLRLVLVPLVIMIL